MLQPARIACACQAYRRDEGLWRRGWRVAAGSNVGRGATRVGAWASVHENDEAFGRSVLVFLTPMSRAPVRC